MFDGVVALILKFQIISTIIRYKKAQLEFANDVFIVLGLGIPLSICLVNEVSIIRFTEGKFCTLKMAFSGVKNIATNMVFAIFSATLRIYSSIFEYIVPIYLQTLLAYWLILQDLPMFHLLVSSINYYYQ